MLRLSWETRMFEKTCFVLALSYLFVTLLAKLRLHFDQVSYSFGNASLIDFDGVVWHNPHRLPRVQEQQICTIAGAGV